MINLSDLMATPLGEQSDEDLVAGLRDAEKASVVAIETSQRIAAELKSRHSWAKLVELTGMPQTTLHQRVNPRPKRSSSS